MTDEPQFEQYRTRVHTVAVVCVFCDAEHGPGVEDRFVQRDGPGTPAICQSCVAAVTGVIAEHALDDKGPRIV